MSEKKPRIAITHSDHQAKSAIFAMHFAVWLAGGKPFSINPGNRHQHHTYDGLILGGGVDINPELYGQIKKTDYAYDHHRDSLELFHLSQAEQQNIPVLGICRGCQLINIYRSGTLHIDITKVYEKAQYPSNLLGYIFFRKRIHILTNSHLFDVIKRASCKVNSIHRQSIAKLGNHLTVTATEENQIVQCIEDASKPFYIGVQFHPEFLIYKHYFLNIFKTLVLSAKFRASSF